MSAPGQARDGAPRQARDALRQAQGERVLASTCHVCGSPALVDAGDPRNPLCRRHLLVRLHIVSMTRAADGKGGAEHVATCRCGWEARRSLGKHRALDLQIRAHWAVVCEEPPCAA